MTSRGTSPAGSDTARLPENKPRWSEIALVALGSLVLFGVAAALAPVTGDEPTFADPARSAALGQGFGAPILAGVVPGAGDRLLWQPPGYFVVLAGWFRAFGFGLLQGRALSALAATVGVTVVYLTTRRYAGVGAAMAALAVAATSSWTLRNASVIRPDTLTLALVASTVLAVLAWEDQRRWRHAALVVGCAAGAVLMHPLGAIAAAFVAVYLTARRQWMGALALPGAAAVIVFLAWGAYVVPYWPEFLEQMQLQGLRKDAAGPLALWSSQDRWRKLGFLPFVVAGVAVLAGRRRLPLAPCLIAVLAVAAAVYGKEEQYPVYVVLFAAPLVALALDRASTRAFQHRLMFGLVAATGLAALIPGAMLFGRGVADLGVGQRIVAATEGRPLFLGPGSYAAYFVGARTLIKVSAPVPSDPRAVGRTVAAQGLVISNDTATLQPLVGTATLRLQGDVAGRQIWVVVGAG